MARTTGRRSGKKKMRCPCEKCGHETYHTVLHFESIRDDDDENPIYWINEYETICCDGCKTVSLRHSHFFSEEMFDGKPSWVKYYPPRLMRRVPDWVDALKPELSGVLIEVYDAVRNRDLRLVAMGIRTVIDAVGRDQFGDLGSFEKHLNALDEEGLISERNKQILETVISAGSAASHRSFKPPEGLIPPLLSIVEALLDQIYISGPILDEARRTIPPRPEIERRRKSPFEDSIVPEVREVSDPPRNIVDPPPGSRLPKKA